MVFRYLKYFFKADTYYQVHSPFIFELAENILEDEREYYAFLEGEKLRDLMKKNFSQIQITDFGAGSKSGNKKTKSISQIAKTAASRKWQCQTMFRLVNFLKPKTMLELGTSLGVSTLYQAKAATNAQFISLEGDPEIAKVAKFNLKEFKTENVEIEIGEFGKTRLPSCQKLGKLDYVFFDGNHQLKPTIEYFETCLNFAHNESVFVFDDIHWSSEMEKAWNKIKSHPQVTISLDLFHFGVVFFRKEKKEKEHFTLAPLSWKPWASTRTFFR